MAKKILVLSASVGAGHLRAAQAVELALRELAPEAEVQNLDVLEFTNSAFRKLYGQAYLDLVNQAPHVLGYLYDRLDRAPSKQRKSDRLRLLVERLNLGRFLRMLRQGKWDVVVNTHYLPAEMLASLRQRGEVETPHFTVTTDFETHRLWVNQPCDHYFTATDEGAAYLAHWGVPRADVTVTGIPIHPVFRRPADRAACLAKHGLAGDRPIVLQLAGGFGVGPVEQILEEMLSLERPMEIVIVAGRNEELKARLDEKVSAQKHRVHVVGFTRDMDELMAVADLVVTKPGGLTSSEALARGAAMVIVNPIPGQESRNSDYLLENGAAIKINHLGTAAFKIGQFLDNPGQLARLKENARRIARPDAAFVIAQAALCR